MPYTRNRIFDDIAKLMTDAAGAAQGVRRDVETVIRSQVERLLREFDVPTREELEAVKDMARLAREENELLKERLAAVEGRSGSYNASNANLPGGG
jgi:BMFP domain-containing protein YqiC